MFKRIYISIIVISVFLVACSTQKNTKASRFYHKTTSAYNVYFNGHEAFLKGIENIRNNVRNDFSTVLPVYEFYNEQSARAGISEMETALTKGTKLVQLHSITTKPARKAVMTEKDKRFYAQEEFNPYIDKGYLLIGMANVVHHSEEDAIAIFDYISRKYEGKESVYEAKIWKSIAYCQIGQCLNAHTALESYDLDGLAPPDMYGKYMAAYANVYICEKNYGEAIKYMEEALNEAKTKYERRRFKYILAQLYRETGQREKAAPLFLELSKGTANDDMTFAAKLDLALVASTDDEIAEAQKKLNKMAKDIKYEDRLDQIYYAIGKLHQNNDDEPAAISNYKKSVDASVMNTNQKGLSFLALSDIYIAKPEYLIAGICIDSASYYLDAANERKKEADELSALLRPLTDDLKNIEVQDSLLRIANMPEKEREKLIRDMVREWEREQQAKEEARLAMEEASMSQSEFYNVASGSRQSATQQWYFYNANLISAGKSTFLGKWGQRANEDDWRRKNKEHRAVDDTTNTDGYEQVMDLADVEGGRIVTRESLLAGLPLTDAEKDSTNRSICRSLFNSGAILYNDIHDYPTAIKQLNEMLRRYPDCPERYDALVLLYFANKRLGNTAEMADIANKIEQEYPDTDFASFLKNGNYFDDQNSEKNVREKAYQETYAAYLNNDFNYCISSSSTALRDTMNGLYASKYLLIRSLSYAKTANTPYFRADLEQIVHDYPNTPEDTLAQKFLALLDDGKTPIRSTTYDSPFEHVGRNQDGTVEMQATFTFIPDTTHSVVCIINPEVKARAQFVIADYNFSNFLTDDFDIYVSNLSDGRTIMTITPFENYTAAMTYFYAIRDQEFWHDFCETAIPEIYAIGDNNLKLAVLSALNAEFIGFWETNYLKKK